MKISDIVMNKTLKIVLGIVVIAAVFVAMVLWQPDNNDTTTVESLLKQPLPIGEPPPVAAEVGQPFDLSLSNFETRVSIASWKRVLELEAENPSFYERVLMVDNFEIANEWARLYNLLHNADRVTQLRYVNYFFNQWRYTKDTENWGIKDYWESPREFVQNSGDCEDYAIVKYFALRALGVPVNELALIIAEYTDSSAEHIVLAVFDGDDFYILDNDTASIVYKNSAPKNYVPTYYINEDIARRDKDLLK